MFKEETMFTDTAMQVNPWNQYHITHAHANDSRLYQEKSNVILNRIRILLWGNASFKAFYFGIPSPYLWEGAISTLSYRSSFRLDILQCKQIVCNQILTLRNLLSHKWKYLKYRRKGFNAYCRAENRANGDPRAAALSWLSDLKSLSGVKLQQVKRSTNNTKFSLHRVFQQ